jgi:hypothetical protein
MLSERDVDWLLDALCVRLGFCLDPMVRDDLKNSPPRDVESFTKVVFQVEGLDPAGVDPQLYAKVGELVAEAYRDQARRQAAER